MLNRFSTIFFGSIGVLLLLAITGSPVWAINKCTDKNGTVTYQDNPCSKSTKKITIEPKASSNSRNQNSDIKVVDVVVNKRKTFSVGFPDHWQYAIDVNADTVPTLRAIENFGDPVRLLMSFLPKRQAVGLDDEVLNRAMQAIHDQHINEKKIRSKKVKQVFSDSVGHVMTYVDEALAKKQTLGKDEFIYLTTGAVVIEGMLITVTILTNDLASENYARAMVAIHTIVN